MRPVVEYSRQQVELRKMISPTLFKGHCTQGDRVEILSGVHGFPDGTVVPDAGLFDADVASVGDLPGVTVHDLQALTPAQVDSILNDRGTIIGGFCASAICLGQ